MAPAYKFTYFNGRGLGEPVRLIFKYAGVEFEDVRIEEEHWPQLKDTTPFGQLPLLEHNGKIANQSISIARYVATQVKLAGNDDWENLEINAIVDTLNDLQQKMIAAFFYEKDEAKKKTLMDTLNNETIPYYLPRIEAIVQKNNGHLALGRLTWADFYFVGISTFFDEFVNGDFFAKYENLKALRDKIYAIPAIKEWVETRPKTPW